MKKAVALLLVLFSMSCGGADPTSSPSPIAPTLPPPSSPPIDNFIIGKVKRVLDHAPFFCPDFTVAELAADLTKEQACHITDAVMWVRLQDSAQEDLLLAAKASGALVSVSYHTAPVSSCWIAQEASLVMIQP